MQEIGISWRPTWPRSGYTQSTGRHRKVLFLDIDHEFQKGCLCARYVSIFNVLCGELTYFQAAYLLFITITLQFNVLAHVVSL